MAQAVLKHGLEKIKPNILKDLKQKHQLLTLYFLFTTFQLDLLDSVWWYSSASL